MSIQNENGARLLRILPQLRDAKPGDAFKLKAPGFMDLNVDVLQRVAEGGSVTTMRISLAHNYVQEGDVMADPDMECRLIIAANGAMLQACTFQQSAPPIFQRVEHPASPLQRKLDAFLAQWLTNIGHQGHKLPEVAP